MLREPHGKLVFDLLMGEADLDDLVRQAELELSRPGTWGTPVTLIPAYASLSV